MRIYYRWSSCLDAFPTHTRPGLPLKHKAMIHRASENFHFLITVSSLGKGSSIAPSPNNDCDNYATLIRFLPVCHTQLWMETWKKETHGRWTERIINRVSFNSFRFHSTTFFFPSPFQHLIRVHFLRAMNNSLMISRHRFRFENVVVRSFSLPISLSHASLHFVGVAF